MGGSSNLEWLPSSGLCESKVILPKVSDHPVGMAYLLGDWAGRLDDRRLISSMFNISPQTDCPATAVARRSVGVVVNRLVGMGLNVNDQFGDGKVNFN